MFCQDEEVYSWQLRRDRYVALAFLRDEKCIYFVQMDDNFKCKWITLFLSTAGVQRRAIFGQC